MALVGIIAIAISGWISVKHKFPKLLIGVLILVSVALILARFLFPAPGSVTIKIGLILGFHILVTSVGFAILAMGCVSGLLILIRARVLKSVKWSTQSNLAWPSLTTLDGLFAWSMGMGTLVLTIGIILGILLAPEVQLKGHWYFDPKVILSTLGWALYGWVWIMRKKQGFSSKTMVATATLGYFFVLLGFFLSSLFATGFHRF